MSVEDMQDWYDRIAMPGSRRWLEKQARERFFPGAPVDELGALYRQRTSSGGQLLSAHAQGAAGVNQSYNQALTAQQEALAGLARQSRLR